ncbi:hypothetical protein [Amycolatopsis sp. cmx-4-83]|uniref:hypothetical protein n=1 Tax=Amycolatopsis sp. cmx-4-83 TaxID=2790940 RepID=UPI00397A5A93
MNVDGYAAMDEHGRELTVLYYRDAAAIEGWKQQWYANYYIEVTRVERAYGFTRQEEPSEPAWLGRRAGGPAREIDRWPTSFPVAPSLARGSA